MLVLKISLLLSFLLFGCHDSEPSGFLMVTAPENGGTYEVYRVDGDGWQHYSTEEIGAFNIPLELTAGHYLVLTDCSSKDVVIYEGDTSTIDSYQLDFKLPQPLNSDDQLLVQCVRHDKTGVHQTLRNKTRLHLFGERELLVGMRSLKITSSDPSRKEVVELGGLRVEQKSDDNRVSYFVSPVDPLFSTTMHQSAGSWLYLVPGDYQIMLNGTREVVSLSARSLLTRRLAQVRFQAPEDIPLQDYVKVRGSPAHIEVNGSHDFELNQTYSVLPGELRAKIDGSHEYIPVVLNAGEKQVISLRSVQVRLDCSPWDWSCLGQQEVLLYHKGEDYPFSVGQSDMPLLFLGEEVLIGLGGSRNIRYSLGKQRVIQLNAGRLKLVPVPTYWPGHLTELARLEGSSRSYDGYSHDIQPNKAMTMTVIAGRYDLSRFVCSGSCYGSGDGERWEQRRSIVVPPLSTVEYEFNYFMREHHYAQAREKHRDQRKRQSRRAYQKVPYLF